MRVFQDRFESSVHSAVHARRLITEFARACGFSAADLFDLTLAAGEACTNAVEHGHVAEGYFMVECACDDDWFKVTIHDNGAQGMRERILPGKDRVGGLGIFLIRELMDEVNLEADAKGTIISFRKRMEPRPQDQAAIKLSE